MEFSKLGVAFVDDNIPDYKQVEMKIAEKEEELINEAKEKLDQWLNQQGLDNVMGIIVPIKKKKRMEAGNEILSNHNRNLI